MEENHYNEASTSTSGAQLAQSCHENSIILSESLCKGKKIYVFTNVYAGNSPSYQCLSKIHPKSKLFSSPHLVKLFGNVSQVFKENAVAMQEKGKEDLVDFCLPCRLPQ